MDIFYRWLIGDMGTPGDYQYQAIHGYSVLAVVLALVVVCIFAVSKKLTQQHKKGILIGICIFQIVFEVAWRLIYFFVKGDELRWWWPMYPCNLGGVLIPIIALCNWKTGKKMFYLFGFIGGVLTFAIPDGIFSSDVMVFPIVKSILQHTGLLLIPAFEYLTGTFRPSLRHYGWAVGGMLVHVLNCEVVARWFGFYDDYMFFRSDMPFVIPGVPQFITLSVFGLLVVALLSYLCDIKDSTRFLKNLKGEEKHE
ncbi:MAG: hypothetical protein E7470_08460 [Ruminococcaceae bacterium]|nr:hypothetical protein [Oscillospiraceae bacterium]